MCRWGLPWRVQTEPDHQKRGVEVGDDAQGLAQHLCIPFPVHGFGQGVIEVVAFALALALFFGNPLK